MSSRLALAVVAICCLHAHVAHAHRGSQGRAPFHPRLLVEDLQSSVQVVASPANLTSLPSEVTVSVSGVQVGPNTLASVIWWPCRGCRGQEPGGPLLGSLLGAAASQLASRYPPPIFPASQSHHFTPTLCSRLLARLYKVAHSEDGPSARDGPCCRTPTPPTSHLAPPSPPPQPPPPPCPQDAGTQDLIALYPAGALLNETVPMKWQYASTDPNYNPSGAGTYTWVGQPPSSALWAIGALDGRRPPAAAAHTWWPLKPEPACQLPTPLPTPHPTLHPPPCRQLHPLPPTLTDPDTALVSLPPQV